MLIVPSSALAQPKPAGRMPRVGFVLITPTPAEFTGPDPTNPAVRGFVHGLRDLGYVSGRNVVVDIRSIESKWDRLEGIIADLVRLKTDVIVCSGALVSRVAKLAPGVPIVIPGQASYVGTDLIKTYARPGGNVTGITMDAGPDIEAKRLALLLEILPGARRVAYVGPGEHWEGGNGEKFRSAARAMKVAVIDAGAKVPDYSVAVERIRKEKPDAVFVSSASQNYGYRDQIGELVRTIGVPSTCAWAELADAGCMMSFGVDVPHAFRSLAGYVDKILKGAKPGDLPIEQPAKFEIVVNLKIAKALGITLPRSVLLRADRVIE